MRVRAATLNAWSLPEPFAQDVSARMGEIGRRLGTLGLDAIAFQEVWTSGGQASLRLAGRRAGLAHAWHGGSGFRGSGLLVLSRLPIEGARFERYLLRGIPSLGDYWGGKGFVEVRIATPAGPLALVDTHLHARYTNGTDHEYRSHRGGQIVQLASAVAHLPAPLLVAGDFNLHDELDEYRVLLGLAGLRDAAAELGRREATVYRANPYRADTTKPDRRIDLLLTRDGAETGVRIHHVERVFDDLFEHAGRRIACSDHAGVLAELELLPGQGAPLPAPDPGALALAERLLAEGRALAHGHRRDGRLAAGAGVGAALLATAGLRSRPLSRRRLLRGAMQAAGLAAVAPVLPFSFVSEVVAPDALRAFDTLAARLERLAALRGGAWPGPVEALAALRGGAQPAPPAVTSRSLRSARR
jgi:endonuclease/exonuclease/phosphatase family metal-dependent hydrolase